MKSPIAPPRHVSLGGYAAKQCAELLRKDLDPAYPEDWKDERDSFTMAIMEAGNHFEGVTVLDAIMEAIPSYVVVDTTKTLGPKRLAAVLADARDAVMVIFEGTRDPASLVTRENVTHALCEQPGRVRVLWNPRLRKWRKDSNGRTVWSNRAAEPDLLYRQGSRVTRSPKWGSIDVKYHYPFEGTAKGHTWNLSPLGAPYPERSKPEAYVGTLKKVDAFQLSHYHRSLEFHALAGNALGGIIGKELDGELMVVWLDLNDRLYERGTTSALTMYDGKFAHALAVANREMDRIDDPTLAPLAVPEWKSECASCVWRTTCHDELSVADHITLLPGITPARAQAHYAAGVTDVRGLARLDTPTAAVIDAGVADLGSLITAARSGDFAPSSSVSVLLAGTKTAKQSAACNAAGITTVGEVAGLDEITACYPPTVHHLVHTIDQARVVDYARVRKQTHVFRARGIETLDIPSAPVEIHVDMENDEHIYLWGVRVVWHENDRVRTTHRAFATFEANDAAEAANTVDFWSYLTELIAKAEARHGAGSALVFHYTAAEDRCLRALAKKHVGVKGMPTVVEIEDFLASDTWVDLYPILTTQLVWPTEDLTLKSLAKYTRFIWRDEDPSGSNSVVWYQRAIDPTEPEREKWAHRIVEYNEDDCAATAALLEWLQRFGEVNNLGRKLSRVEDLEARSRRIRR